MVPYLLGFHPRDSLVLVGIDGDFGPIGEDAFTGTGHITVVARMDLAALTATTHAAERSALIHSAAATIARSGAVRAALVLFPDVDLFDHGDRISTLCAGLSDVDAACVAEGIEIVDCLTAVPNAAGDGAERGPGGIGAGVPSRIELEATYAGLVALPDRESLAQLIEPAPDGERDRLREGVRAELAAAVPLDGDAGGRYCRRAVRQLYAAARQLPVLQDGDVARYGAMLTRADVRQACWLAIEHKRLDGEPLWRELARRLPAPYDATPLFLFAWLQWRAGRGALAAIALERALASDPGHQGARLLEAALLSGLDPIRSPRLRRGA